LVYLITVHGEPVSISVMKYNNQTTDVVTDVSSIFRELDHAVQEANVLSQNAGGELS